MYGKTKLFGLVLFILLGTSFTAYAVDVLTGRQGGTGIGSATVGDIGNCLKVLTNSPFSYELGTCGSGSGGGNSKFATSTDGVNIQPNSGQGLNVTASSTFSSTLNVGGLFNASSTSLFQNIIAYASSTFQNLTFVNATGTQATTTNFQSTTAKFTNFILNNQLFTSLLGTGLTNTAGVLTNSGVISNSCPGGFLSCSGTNPSSFTLGTLGIDNGGTNSTALQKSLLWFDGTRVAATGTQVTVGNLVATNTAMSIFNGPVSASSTALFGANSIFYGSTTLQRFTGTNATTTSATSTTLNVSRNFDVSGTATSTFGGDISLGSFLKLGAYNTLAQITGLDADTGIGFDGPDILSFHTAGTNRMYLTSTGNVGIADQSPLHLLTVGSGDLFGISSAGVVHASSTALFTSGFTAYASTTLQDLTARNATTSQATTTSLAISNLTSALIVTGASGNTLEYAGTSCTNQFVRSLDALGVATCATVQNTDLANSSVTVNGTSISLGGSGTVTAASSTLLIDNNTFTGSNVFSGLFSASSTSLFQNIISYASSTFQAITATSARFNGVLQASSTALFGNGLTAYASSTFQDIQSVDAIMRGGIATSTSGDTNLAYLSRLTHIYSTSTVGTTTIQFTGAEDSKPSFSAATLTLPTNTAYVKVSLWAGGGGGSGGGTGNPGGIDGATSTRACFGTNSTVCSSPMFSATGGGPGRWTTSAGGPGGVGSGGDVNLEGNSGGASFSVPQNSAGNNGGSSALGAGAGGSGKFNSAGLVGGVFGGGGGGGASQQGLTVGFIGAGGGGGGHVSKLLYNVSGNTFYFNVTDGGSGGVAGTNGQAGGKGGSGGLILEIYTY